MNAPTMILNTSPEAATYRTDICGWVSRRGNYYGDGPGAERTARWDGCTHVACEDCGAPTTKDWLACPTCRATHDLARYLELPVIPYTGQEVYSDAHQRFFFGEDSIIEYCLEEDISPTDLRLMTCTPIRAHELDPHDIYHDQLDDDRDDIPSELEAAFNALNAAIRAYTTPLSYTPGKSRIDPFSLDQLYVEARDAEKETP